MTDELQALADADFGWVQSLESVWSDDGAADAGVNRDLVSSIVADAARLTRPAQPPGRALLGQAGIGKTHLVGVLRRDAWAAQCWFVLLDVVGITDFWKSAALSYLTSLLQEMPDGRRQYEAVIAGVARRFRIENEVRIAFDSPDIEPRRVVDLLVRGLIKADPANAFRFQDVFRALSLLRSQDVGTVGVAHAWLQGYDADEAARRTLGFLTPPPAPVEIVRGLAWVMGLAGPTVVAVDQIDGVLGAGRRAVDLEGADEATFARMLTGGLLDLTTVLGRGLLVLTALPSSWEIVRNTAPAALLQRFLPPTSLRPLNSEDAVRSLIAGRLAPAYAKAGVALTTPTGPFTEAAIRSAAGGMTPRLVLMRCDDHRRRCLADGAVIPCDSLVNGTDTSPQPPIAVSFDEALEAARLAADLEGLFDPKDDGALGQLLRDSFDLYVKQIPPHADYDVVSKADPAQKTPPLHGRVTFTDHLHDDSELHFCFRALQHAHPVALCSRFRAALTASGIAASIPHRQLIVVRRGPVPSGAKSKELFDALRASGGLVIDPEDDDLRTFLALRDLRDAALAASGFDDFERWLRDRQPLCDTAFFKAARLAPPPLPPFPPAPSRASAPIDPAPADPSPEEAPRSASQAPRPTTPRRPPVAASIPVGHRVAGGDPVALQTSLLPRHTAIIAGAGSGKTVLLRRLVEEAALAGIPAIVVDPNNDLSRLGDPWPEPPAAFEPADADKARRYADTVEVVVWTPGIHAGNPLALSVLPDFAAIGDDPDERGQAVTMAADTLGPLAGARTSLLKGVLADALRHFAAAGGGSLATMTALLADLPDGVSEIGNAGKLAARMADELKASIATNPLLKSAGPALDPALLFHGPDEARTRVSVVNLSGLASQEAREDFVNRLQMTLFGWIKKHPSPHGMLYVIDEAQTFIPATGGALSKTSGVQLVAQARKYGLGMIVATQAPKGVDNKLVSNCTTQFLGKQNAPATIEAAKELIAASGGRADDLGRLATGEFYFKTEKSGKPAKVRTPVCLSHHPANPPTPEEVVARARRSALRPG